MKPVTIHNFDDVILFELQQKLNVGAWPELTFNEIWRACEAAGKNFVIPINPYTNRRQFVAQIFEYIKRLELEGKIEVIMLVQDRIDHISLTDVGNEYLDNTVFTNQQILQ